MREKLAKFFPFLLWFTDYDGGKLRTDALAGITVAMVLIPQSMAYAQLAGLPAYYGLYAAFSCLVSQHYSFSSSSLKEGGFECFAHLRQPLCELITIMFGFDAAISQICNILHLFCQCA